jgi:CDP-diacylglycerol--serine O-phosphatidyltransferase
LMGAALFDKLDGAVARKLGLTEDLGKQKPKKAINFGSLLDDISDTVSFCIAPAWIFYITLSNYSDPVIQQLPLGWIAWLYAVMGIARLIYFTLDKSPIRGFFKGMPTTAAAMLVMSGLIIFSQAVNDASDWARFWGIFSFGLIILAAVMMNLYPLRYLHLGRFMSRHPWFARGTLVVIGSVFTPYFGQACLIYMFLYTLSPIITWRIEPEVAARETQTKTA